MSSNPFFSVVIPSYNRADLIMETIDTVLKQTFRHYEIIVVDNCSTDNTVELLTPLADAGTIRFIRHDKNYERARSRNTGMAAATGEWVTLLDSDDFMYADCLKDAYAYATANPAIRVFHNKYELVNNARQRVMRWDFPSLDNQYKALAGGNFISCIGGFIHKDLYKEVRFNEDPKMVGSEDYEVWFTLLAAHQLGRVDRTNCGVREHVNRSVHQGVFENLEYQKTYLLRKIRNTPELYRKFGPYLKKLESSFLLQQAIVTNQLRKKSASLKNLLCAVKKYPAVLSSIRFYKVLYNTIK